MDILRYKCLHKPEFRLTVNSSGHGSCISQRTTISEHSAAIVCTDNLLLFVCLTIAKRFTEFPFSISFLIGGRDGARSHNLQFAKLAISQLIYTPMLQLSVVYTGTVTANQPVKVFRVLSGVYCFPVTLGFSPSHPCGMSTYNLISDTSYILCIYWCLSLIPDIIFISFTSMGRN